MPIQRVFKKGKVPVKVYTNDIAPEAIQQLENISHLPFIHSHIAAMPDVHLGKGATVWFGDPNQESDYSCCSWRGYRLWYECCAFIAKSSSASR